MPFAISTVRRFSASHQLAMYDGSLELLHGHDWVVKVTVTADELDKIGVVMDFHELERRSMRSWIRCGTGDSMTCRLSRIAIPRPSKWRGTSPGAGAGGGGVAERGRSLGNS